MPKSNGMPEYQHSQEEWFWYKWCMDNNIRVSPGGTKDPNSWTIDISTDGKTWKKSPKTYTREDIWREYYLICKWFYKKYKK